MSFEMEELLKTPYVRGVYSPTPLVVSHPREEEESEIAMSSDSPLSTGASQWRRLISDDDE